MPALAKPADALQVTVATAYEFKVVNFIVFVNFENNLARTSARSSVGEHITPVTDYYQNMDGTFTVSLKILAPVQPLLELKFVV